MDALTKEILELHVSGNPASKIDEELRLAQGTAHDTIVEWWIEQNEKHATTLLATPYGVAEYE